MRFEQAPKHVCIHAFGTTPTHTQCHACHSHPLPSPATTCIPTSPTHIATNCTHNKHKQVSLEPLPCRPCLSPPQPTMQLTVHSHHTHHHTTHKQVSLEPTSLPTVSVSPSVDNAAEWKGDLLAVAVSADDLKVEGE